MPPALCPPVGDASIGVRAESASPIVVSDPTFRCRFSGLKSPADRYVYDANGRLDRIENEDCTSGDAVAEQYTYDEAGQTSQVTERKLYEFAPSQGACVRSEMTDTDVAYGDANSSQEGAITEVVEDSTPGVAGGEETTEFEQNESNMLSAVTKDGETKVITHDGEDRPVEETSPNGSGGVESADLTYAGDDRNAATIAELGDPVARGQLTAPNGWLIAEHREPSGYDRYYLTDHLGTPVSEYGRSGSHIGTYAYDPYGVEDQLHTSGDMTTTIGFAGERADAETGLTSHDARNYSATLRVWVTTDQYADPDEDLSLAMDPLNSSRMQYAGGDPINGLDPDGHRVIYPSSGKTLYAPVQIGADGSVWSMSSSSGSRNYGSGPTAKQRAAVALAATKARWARDPRSTAYKQAHCLWSLTNGRCMNPVQQATYEAKLEHYKAETARIVKRIEKERAAARKREEQAERSWMSKAGGAARGTANFLILDDVRGCAGGSKKSCLMLAPQAKIGKVAVKAWKGGKALRKSCRMNSFTGETLVTMADGTSKPIRFVGIGDYVLATDPSTGETGPRRVEDLIRHFGAHKMVRVTLGDGRVIDATEGHPFWETRSGRRVDATAIEAGMSLRGANGHFVNVVSVYHSSYSLTAYNLTVTGIHTYYVGATPVLVHNCAAKKASKQSGKQRATDVPSWAQGVTKGNKSAHKAVSDLLNAKYGQGNWKKGAGTEYSKIKKYLDRG